MRYIDIAAVSLPKTQTTTTTRALPTSSIAFSSEQLRRLIELSSASDVYRRIFLGPDTIQRARAVNERVTQALTAPAKKPDGGHPLYYRVDAVELSPEKNFATSLDLLRHQLRSCYTPEDLIRVFTTALDRRPGAPNSDGKGARLLASPSIQHLIGKCLIKMPVSQALPALGLFISRLEAEELVVDSYLLWRAQRAAAFCHALTAFRLYSKKLHEHEQRRPVSREQIIELLYCLVEGYENARKFKRLPNRQGLFQCLMGFKDPAFSDPCHLRAYMPLGDWVVYKLFIDALATCQQGEALLQEWEWLKSCMRSDSQWPGSTEERARFEDGHVKVFVQALRKAGDHVSASRIRREGKGHVGRHDTVADPRSKPRLQSDSGEEIKAVPEDNGAALTRLSELVQELENELGFEWVTSESSLVAGYHRLRQDLHQGVTELWNARYISTLSRQTKEKGLGLHNRGSARTNAPKDQLPSVTPAKAQQKHRDAKKSKRLSAPVTALRKPKLGTVWGNNYLAR